MNSCEFRQFDFQNNLGLLRLKKLIAITGLSLIKCSKYFKRIEALRTSGRYCITSTKSGNTNYCWICREARIWSFSCQNLQGGTSLQSMGYTRTFAQLKAKYSSRTTKNQHSSFRDKKSEIYRYQRNIPLTERKQPRPRIERIPTQG